MIYNATIKEINETFEVTFELLDVEPIILNYHPDQDDLNKALTKTVCRLITLRKPVDMHPVGLEELPYGEMESVLWHHASWSNRALESVEMPTFTQLALDYAQKHG